MHLVPLTWEDEVRLLKRELDRAWSSLKLEEHRNRNLPELVAATNPDEYDALAERSARRFLDWLRDEEIFTYTDYLEPALRAHLGSYVPEETRNFFWIAAHYDPTPLYTHFYHWFELARMDTEPHVSPVRQGSLLYNIFDSRNEGTATGVEEMFMHAGLYDEQPRSREVVWIMLAQRAARGLGSLYAHANEMTMEEAGGVHTEWDSARLDEDRKRATNIRAAFVPAPTRLRHQLRDRQVPVRAHVGRLQQADRRTR